MIDEGFEETLTSLIKELDKLEFDSDNPDSVLDLLSIKNRASEASKGLSNKKYRKKCLYELDEVCADEILSLKKAISEDSFFSAQSELRCVLQDLVSGRFL